MLADALLLIKIQGLSAWVCLCQLVCVLLARSIDAPKDILGLKKINSDLIYSLPFFSPFSLVV